ncbi:MAG TPA: arginine deiminase-related protein, partial [Candidatus Acidoferrum sp.]|nr:arginine deiminase-related protein [Candidatus Acidoferrum sp.]
SISNRSSPQVIRRFSQDFGYEPVMFSSNGLDGQSIYHTNVMMCVGTEFALVGLGMIPNELEKEQVRTRLNASGKEIVELKPDQVANFAGNALELDSGQGDKVLILSERAVSTFSAEQLAAVRQYARLVPLNIPTIEMGGGSARCMIATIHLPLLKRR